MGNTTSSFPEESLLANTNEDEVCSAEDDIFVIINASKLANVFVDTGSITKSYTTDQRRELGISTQREVKQAVHKYNSHVYPKRKFPVLQKVRTAFQMHMYAKDTAVDKDTIPSVDIFTQTFANPSDDPINVSHDLSQTSTNSVTSSWSRTTTNSVATTISASVETPVVSGGIEHSMSLSEEDQESGSTTSEGTMGSVIHMSFSVDPGKVKRVYLRADKVTVYVTINWDLSPSPNGKVLAYYKKQSTFRKHGMVWSIPVEEVYDGIINPSLTRSQTQLYEVVSYINPVYGVENVETVQTQSMMDSKRLHGGDEIPLHSVHPKLDDEDRKLDN